MTATVEPSGPAVEDRRRAALARADGVELLGDVHGSGYTEGISLVRRADGQMVQLGPLMYGLLEDVDGRRSTAELAAALSERLGRSCDEEHVVRLAEKLAAQGLLAGTEHRAPPRRNPLLALRWKVLVTNPRATKWLTTPFTVLFRPFVMWPVLACFVAVCWFVLVHKGVASATAQAFHRPGLLLLVFALAIASAGFHELGHASACRYGGATPGGMGMGLYMVWPAFYTDVTDCYRLPRRDRLRVDLAGLYFNAVVAVATMAVWLAWHVDALLLLVALQLLQMVKQLSPVIRADGYHILSDATGVPDLYSHMGPTLRRLLPGRHREPSALTGRARLLVTLWVLVVVPVLLSLMLGAILLLPRMVTSAWETGHAIAAGIPHEADRGQVVDLLASLVRLLALLLPVLGSILVTQRIVRRVGGKARDWSDGRPARSAVLVAAAAAVAAGAAWAWWPSGQYRPVRAADGGTLGGLGELVSAPRAVARPATGPAPVHLAPGTYLAVAMIPTGGATRKHPALFVITRGKNRPSVALLSSSAPAPTAGASTVQTTTTPTTTTAPTATTTAAPTPPADAAPVQVTAFPFQLPSAPGPGDSQAVAVGTKDGGVTYDVVYSLVTVRNGAPVTNGNGAFAFANCKACTTVAVSFQVVLVVGRSKSIAPINAAGALNVDCPACLTTAIADQIVVTLESEPSPALVAKLEAALQQLNALPALGAGGSPAAVAAQVALVQQQIETALDGSGQLARPLTSTSASTTTAVPGTTTRPTTTAPPPTTTAPGAAPPPATTTSPAGAPTTTPTTTAAAGPSTTPTTTAQSPATTATTTTAPAATTTPTTTGAAPPPSTTTPTTTTGATTTTSSG